MLERDSQENEGGRYSADTVRRPLEQYLSGRSSNVDFSLAVIDLWNELAEAEQEVEDRRPSPLPSELARLGIDPSEYKDSLTPREQKVRDIIAGLEEDIRWWIGDRERDDQPDDAFWTDELRSIAQHWLNRIRALDESGD